VPVVAIAVESTKWVLIVGVARSRRGRRDAALYPIRGKHARKIRKPVGVARRATRSWDDMHMNLDALVEAHPKPAGWIIACTSAAGVISAIIMLVRYY